MTTEHPAGAEGDKDRSTLLAEVGRDGLRVQLRSSEALHRADRQAGLAGVWMPDALECKYPNAGRALRAEVAQAERERALARTRDALWHKARAGYVAGGKIFGYDNHRLANGHVERRINEAEAAVVRDIYTRFAAGEGLRTIALALNRAGLPSIRAQRGRAAGGRPPSGPS
ncbi:MAG: hypothetical protein EHM13_00060 [Acidobacteria bacterium]|nr:MAG: hypothetical protein EHM13_00060 [Acidobacteriota bacterium]